MIVLRLKSVVEMRLSPTGTRTHILTCQRSNGPKVNVRHSNGNASETNAKESFDNGVFFDMEAKRTPSIVSKLFLKQSKHIR